MLIDCVIDLVELRFECIDLDISDQDTVGGGLHVILGVASLLMALAQGPSACFSLVMVT